MKVSISCIGKFHHFDLARQLSAAGCLDVIYTGYPRWKLRNEQLPADKVDTFPWLHVPYMSQGRWPIRSASFSCFLGKWAGRAHDWHVAHLLATCDVFVGLSGHNANAGRRAKQLGAKWVCDRGSSHIVYQDDILREEHSIFKIPFSGVPKWAIDNEINEYAQCDLITVPSLFSERTFIEKGVPAEKIRRVTYGVDLNRFQKVAVAVSGRFDICFVGAVCLQKGVPYLVEAFRLLKHPRKKLRIIGAIDPLLSQWVGSLGDASIEFIGPVPQVELKLYLSRSHVFVLPSIQDGFGMVMAQAMACGCPVIATANSGGPDLIQEGVTGMVVPIRDSEALASALQRLADDPDLQQQMSSAALLHVKNLGGWDRYGADFISVLNELCGDQGVKND